VCSHRRANVRTVRRVSFARQLHGHSEEDEGAITRPAVSVTSSFEGLGYCRCKPFACAAADHLGGPASLFA
jgi:hypothetical protein